MSPRGVYERTRSDPVARFWSYVDRDGPVSAARPDLGPCWLWTSTRDRRGYGRFWDGTKIVLAHHSSAGKPPEGLEWDHLCRTTSCIRPSHLEAVTHRVNVERGEGGGQWAAKTHCPQGHAYDESNTYVYRGRRNCRICARDRVKAFSSRRGKAVPA